MVGVGVGFGDGGWGRCRVLGWRSWLGFEMESSLGFGLRVRFWGRGLGRVRDKVEFEIGGQGQISK